jgi:hypothetical protein
MWQGFGMHMAESPRRSNQAQHRCTLQMRLQRFSGLRQVL